MKITFKTSAPGVVIPKQLMQRFPDEMTVVLQNKFWDLTVDEEGFEVGLTFSQVPTKLFVPFAAITAFVDPAVEFALHFQVNIDDVDTPPTAEAGNDTPRPTAIEDGSNVVTVDFGRKK
jgi:hypothetical protein